MPANLTQSPYMNGGQPGPLLDDDPTNVCGDSCYEQPNWAPRDETA